MSDFFSSTLAGVGFGLGVKLIADPFNDYRNDYRNDNIIVINNVQKTEKKNNKKEEKKLKNNMNELTSDRTSEGLPLKPDKITFKKNKYGNYVMIENLIYSFDKKAII